MAAAVGDEHVDFVAQIEGTSSSGGHVVAVLERTTLKGPAPNGPVRTFIASASSAPLKMTDGRNVTSFPRQQLTVIIPAAITSGLPT